MVLFNKKKEIFLIIIIVVSTIVFLGWEFLIKKNEPILDNKTNVTVNKQKNFYKNISLEANSAFVWDVKNHKVLFSKNSEAQLPLASLTKLMTALISSELVPEGTIITIRKSDIDVEGDSGLMVGEKWTLKNALDFTLMASSNDGAHALASVIGYVRAKKKGETERNMFIDEMNKKAKELHLSQTYFLSESGLDLNKVIGGAFGSARDMAFLMSYILKNSPNILEATKYSVLKIKSKEYTHLVKNTNQDAETIPGILGSKTGFTDLAGGNLVVAFDIGIGHPIIVSVLGSSREGRFKDVKKLINASIKQIANNEYNKVIHQ